MASGYIPSESGVNIGNSIYARLNWWEPAEYQNPDTNTSQVWCKLEMCSAAGYNAVPRHAKISINGSIQSAPMNNTPSLPADGSWVKAFNATHKVDVRHDDNTGEKSIVIKAKLWTGDTEPNTYAINGADNTVDLSKLTQLCTIATISPSPVYLGESVTITINRPSNIASVKYRFSFRTYNSASVNFGSGTSLVYTLDSNWANALGDLTSDWATVYIETYDENSNLLGTKSGTFWVYKQRAQAPTVAAGWVTLTPDNGAWSQAEQAALDGFGRYIGKYSKIKATFDSSKITLYGSGTTISTLSITISGVTYTVSSGSSVSTPIYNATGQLAVRATVTDSNGMFAYQDFVVTFYAYSPPSLTQVSVYRCDSSAVPDDTGSYFYIQAAAWHTIYNNSSDVDQNPCTISYRYKTASGSSWGAWATYSPGNDTGELVNAQLSNDYEYVVQVRAMDTLGAEDVDELTLYSAPVLLHSPNGGNGVAFGHKYSLNAGGYIDSKWPIWNLDIRTGTVTNVTTQGASPQPTFSPAFPDGHVPIVLVQPDADGIACVVSSVSASGFSIATISGTASSVRWIAIYAGGAMIGD